MFLFYMGLQVDNKLIFLFLLRFVFVYVFLQWDMKLAQYQTNLKTR